MLGPVRARQFLTVDFALQFHESVQQRFWPRRATGNVNINWDVTVDTFEHVIALLERPAGNGARAHRNHIFWIGHLVVEPDDLRRHFFCHRTGDNHEIGLTRRWPENFAAKPRNIVARGGSRDHLDRAAGEPKLQRPNRVLASPVVKLLHRSHPDSLSLQFLAQPFVDFAHRFRCNNVTLLALLTTALASPI